MTPELSIVVPMYNEQDNVQPLYEAVCAALKPHGLGFELILVDDGSNDDSLNRMTALASEDSRLVVVRLRRNFGQTIAMQTGISLARGEILVTMDGDLQNDPCDIPRMVERIREGNDLVTGWRKNRQDRWLSRKLPSRIANWLIRRFLGLKVHDFGCTLRAYRADLIRQIPLYSDLHRFIPAMCSMATARIDEIVVHHMPRRFGKSKYGLSRTWRVLIDTVTLKMLLSCSRRPFYWFGYWALGVFVLAAMAGVAGIVSVATLPDAGSYQVWPGITLLLSYLGFHLLLAGIFTDLVIRSEPVPRISPLLDVVRTRTIATHASGRSGAVGRNHKGA